MKASSRSFRRVTVSSIVRVKLMGSIAERCSSLGNQTSVGVLS